MKRTGPTALHALGLGAVLAAGLVLAHHPMIGSGLRRVQAEPVDPRLINYVLEHTYRWLTGDPLHHRLWDPPVYYPTPNVLAFSDTLLSAAPIYWAWRGLGPAPDTAYQLWVLTASALNALGGYLLLRRGVGTGAAGAAAGAFLFAFGAPRVSQVVHPQLYLHFYTSLILYFLCLAFRRRDDPPWRRGLYWCGASLGLAAQTYAAFYLAWFLLLGLAAAAAWAVALGAFRKPLVKVARQDWWLALVAGAVGALAVWPLARHARAAAGELGFRTLYEARLSVPDWRSWVYLGPHSWAYGRMPRLILFHGIPLEPEHRLGIGLLTTLAAAAGLYLGRDRPAVRLSALAGLGVWLCVTSVDRPVVLNLSILALAVCVTWLVLDPGGPRRFVPLSASAGVLTAALVPWPVMMIAAPLAGIALVVAAVLSRRGFGARVWTYPLAVFALFGCFVTYSDWFPVWGLGAAGVVAGSVALRRRGYAPSTRLLVVAALVPALVLFAFGETFSAWKYLHAHVFGANAIRAVGRSSLVLLVPASVGLACAVEELRRRGRTGLVFTLGILCALEQGVSTPSFDKYVERAHAHEVARQVPPDCQAFFAGAARRTLRSPWEPHLDAMWAQLECGVPTINGYSGGLPKGWFALYEPNPATAGATLVAWARAHGLDPARVCWVNGQPEEFGLMRPRPTTAPP
jgi:hypothetical protein